MFVVSSLSATFLMDRVRLPHEGSTDQVVAYDVCDLGRGGNFVFRGWGSCQSLRECLCVMDVSLVMSHVCNCRPLFDTGRQHVHVFEGITGGVAHQVLLIVIAGAA